MTVKYSIHYRMYRRSKRKLLRFKHALPALPSPQVPSTINPLKWKRALRNRKTKEPRGHTEARFFRLPMEIRFMIYERVLGSNIIHIRRDRKNRAHGIPCLDPQQDKRKMCICLKGVETGEYRTQGCVHGIPIMEFPRPGIGVVGTMLACRMMYAEMTELVYKRTTFAITSPNILHAFSSQVPPNALQKITSLHLDGRFGDWPEFESYQMTYNFRRFDTFGQDRFPYMGSSVVAWDGLRGLLVPMSSLKRLKVSFSLSSGYGVKKGWDERATFREPWEKFAKSIGDGIIADIDVI